MNYEYRSVDQFKYYIKGSICKIIFPSSTRLFFSSFRIMKLALIKTFSDTLFCVSRLLFLKADAMLSSAELETEAESWKVSPSSSFAVHIKWSYSLNIHSNYTVEEEMSLRPHYMNYWLRLRRIQWCDLELHILIHIPHSLPLIRECKISEVFKYENPRSVLTIL